MTLTRAEIGLIVLVGLLFLFVLFLVGRYVHWDAARHGMNAAKWTLIAVLAPALSGFAIYLLVRGTAYTGRCPCCGMPVAADWIVCPKCAQELPEPEPDTSENPAPPTAEESDRRLRHILLTVLLIPIVTIVLMTAYSLIDYALTPEVGGTSAYIAPAADYVQMLDDPDIDLWWADCVQHTASGSARVLRSRRQEDGVIRTRYLIYIPGLTENSEVDGFKASDGPLGGTIRVNAVGGGGADALLVVGSFEQDGLGAIGVPSLCLMRNGSRLKYTVTDFDFSPNYEPVSGTAE